jgi:hypothetical protein
MRLTRSWRIAALMSAVLLLSGSDLCMISTCARLESQRTAPVAAEHCCGGGSANTSGPAHGSDHRAMPCNTQVALTSGPQLSSPAQHQATAVALAVPVPPPVDLAHSGPSRGLGPPGRSLAPPSSPFLDAASVRAPPIA